MKSNEEYLDELLKAMEGDTGSTSTPEIPQGVADNDEASEADSSSAIPGADEEEQDTLSENSLEQLMAEIQKSAQDFEDIDFSDDDMMSEESIDALLNEAKASTEMSVEEAPIEEGAEESFDLNDHEDLAEINELLDKDEKKEIVEEVEAPEEEAALSMEDMAAMEIPIEAEQEFSMEDLDSLLEDRSAGESLNKKEKKKWEKKVKRENSETKDSEAEPKGFKKFLSLLFEEEPDEMEPEEAKDMNLSEENKEILSQLDREEKSKAKNKKKKAKGKGKNEAEEEAENSKKKKVKKAPKPKKEKKSKKEKPMREESNERPEKLLPKKKVIVTAIFAASLLVAILLLEYLVPPLFTLNDARTAYEQQEYKDAYQEFYGENLNEGDEERFQSSRAVMRMQTNLDSYYSFLEIGDEVKALHYLIEGVHARDDVYALAESYFATADVEKVYMEILAILSADYGLTQEDALEIIAEKSDLVYTRKLQAIVNGTEYVESSAAEVSQEDMLPEEEEIFQEPVEETFQEPVEEILQEPVAETSQETAE